MSNRKRLTFKVYKYSSKGKQFIGTFKGTRNGNVLRRVKKQ